MLIKKTIGLDGTMIFYDVFGKYVSLTGRQLTQPASMYQHSNGQRIVMTLQLPSCTLREEASPGWEGRSMDGSSWFDVAVL